MSHPPNISRKRTPKSTGPQERGNAHGGLKLQGLERTCSLHNLTKQQREQAHLEDFRTTPLWRAAEARESMSAPYHVKRLAARHGLSTALAGTIAELAGIGPREAHHA